MSYNQHWPEVKFHPPLQIGDKVRSWANPDKTLGTIIAITPQDTYIVHTNWSRRTNQKGRVRYEYKENELFSDDDNIIVDQYNCRIHNIALKAGQHFYDKRLEATYVIVERALGVYDVMRDDYRVVGTIHQNNIPAERLLELIGVSKLWRTK